MARVVLNPFGSFGDLHPFLAIAIELNRRGHEAIVATSEIYRDKIVAEGVGFAPVRPDLGALATDAELLRRIWDPKHGPEHLLREILIPNARASYEDVAAAANGADLLLTHSASYGGPVAAQKLRIPWLSVVLPPMVFSSAYDPPVFPAALWIRHVHALRPWAFQITRTLMKLELDRWMKPVRELRASLGLPPGANPALEGQFSPRGTLALFSRHFAQPQPDWPEGVTVTGFVYYDQLGAAIPHFSRTQRETELRQFLDAGDPPLVFTLGSSAVMQAGNFFRESIRAAQSLGMRAVVLTGPLAKPLAILAPTSIFITEYAPYSELLPHAAAIVHQGGIGTTAQSLRAGRPMLAVPWSHDQPDNAENLRRLGVARVLRRNQYTAVRAAKEITKLLGDASYRTSASQVREKLAQENGIDVAVDRIEAILS